MIVKQAESGDLPSDPLLRSGVKAERQLAFYLNRAFSKDDEPFVLNSLRLVDAEQPEHDGRPGVCQIDHLVLHRWGAFIVESKSVKGEVVIRDDGTGGDEWTRQYGRKKQGFKSPIRQAELQAQFLRAFLQRHRESLLGRMPQGLRTIVKLISGTDQRGFRNMPIQIIVAFADDGRITRTGGWKEPTKPFQTFVCKADLVVSKIRDKLDKHKSASRLLGDTQSGYGVWIMKLDETKAVAGFLNEYHTPLGTSRTHSQEQLPHRGIHGDLTTKPTTTQSPRANRDSNPATCKSCGGRDLTAHWGKYGYYWKCANCGTNTAMPTVCSVCGTEGHRGETVRIRKEGPKYFRGCEQCGIQECIWTE